MKAPIQLVSTDFDGTIFAEFEDPPIAEAFQSLIGRLQAQGVKWVINTGRDMTSLMEVMARARLQIRPDFLVLVEREIYIHDGARYASLLEWNRRCAEDHAGLFARVRPDIPRLAAWITDRFDATVYEDPWSPLCFAARNNEDADVIHHYLDDYCAEIGELALVRNDVYARFSHRAYNKGTALAEIGRRVGVGADRTFAAGDHLNDLPMLSSRYAAFLAAPANAVPSVRAVVRAQHGRVSHLVCAHGVEDALSAFLADGAPQEP